MTPQTLIDKCQLSGVTIHLDGGALKLRGAPDAVKIAADLLRPHKQEIIRYLLDQFQFDLIDQDENPAELTRVNNMAWEFMRADGMPFAEAIRQAAEIVAACDIAACEAAYVDVRALWKRITTASSTTPSLQ